MVKHYFVNSMYTKRVKRPKDDEYIKTSIITNLLLNSTKLKIRFKT